MSKSSLIAELVRKAIIASRRAPGSPEPGPGTTAPSTPTTIEATALDQAALVSFDVVSSGGSPILVCTVTSSPGGITEVDSGSPILIDGLTNGVEYTFTVTATNAIGTSAASAASNAVTPVAAVTVPDAPTIGTATPGNQSATISFTPPVFDGGAAIETYIAVSAPGGIIGTSATSPITVNGLTNGTAYAFSVKAQNSEGIGASSDASAPVTPANVPGQPSITSVTPGANQLSVAFNAPSSDGGSAITGYTATVSPTGFNASGASSPLVITGLTNGTTYTATVVATNAIGDGPASAASAPAVPVAVPGAPTALSGTPGNGQVSVAFTAPVSTGGTAITGYTVTSSPGGFTGTGSASPIVVTGLTNGTSYTFTATATNAVGTGAASAASAAVVPRTVPGAPTNVVGTYGNGEVSVAFDAPADTGGSAITSYTATSSPGGFTSTGGGSPRVVTGLTNGTAYTFTVTATNVAGTGAASAASAAVTPKTVPGAPTSLVATPGDTEASIAFTAPASDGGSAITGYTVTSSPGALTGTGSASPITVTGLTNGVSYTFTAVATNAVGNSSASSASAAVVVAAVPDAPTINSVTGGDEEVEVAFTAGASDGGRPVTGYTITTYPTLDETAAASSPTTVTGLLNGNTYYFTVRATNVMGDSAESADSDFVTPAGLPSAPEILSRERSGSGSITIFFLPADGNGAPITEYTATSSPGSLTGTVAAASIDSGVTVTGLTNGTDYTFTIKSTNEIGDSAASAATVMLRAGTTPGAPTIGTATASDAQASVAFSAPASDGGLPITSYTATASPGGATASGSVSPIVVTGLQNGVAHTFTVVATNAEGNSAASAASNSVTPTQSTTVPGPPIIGTATRTASQTVSVSFTPPANNGGSAITSYTATSAPGGITGTGSASPISVTGLTNGATYTFTVTATNGSGTGPASGVSNSVVPYTVPGAPTIGTAAAGDSQASVSFAPPVSNGGSAITSYTATSSPGGFTKTGAASPLTVTGLTNGTAYTFTVKANNAAGASAASAASNSVSPAVAVSGPFDAYYSAGWTPLNNRTWYTRLAQAEPGTKSTGRASASYIDERFDTRIYRVANPTDTSPTATDHVVPQYSRRNQFNCDGTKFLLKGSGAAFWVYDAATFTRLNGGNTDGSVGNNTNRMRDSCEYAWHPTDPNKIIFSATNGGLIFWEHDVVTHAQTVKFNLTGRFSALGMGSATNVWTGGDGHPSDDRRYWGWMVRNGTTFLGIAVYDMTTDTLTGLAMTGGCTTCTMSAKGGYIVPGRSGSSTFAAAESAGFTNLVGTRAYKRDFSSFKQMHQGGQHADVGIDAYGNEVFVGVIYTGGLMPDVTTGNVFYRDMATGVARNLYSVWDGSITGVHISCTGTANPGWVICSSFKDTVSGETGWPDQCIIAVELKPSTESPKTLRLAHIRTTAGNYWAQPHATVSADGLQILFGQDWTGGTSIPLAYLIGLPSWAYGGTPPVTPPPPPVGDGNLITNGDFSSGATSWTLSEGGGYTFTNGKAHFDGVANGNIDQTIALVSGTTYDVSVTVSNWNGAQQSVMRFKGGGDVSSDYFSGNGTHTFQMTASATNTYFQLRSFAGLVADFDDIRVVESTADNNILTNGQFTTASDWTATNGGWAIGSGVAAVATAVGAVSDFQQALTLTAGTQYFCQLDLTRTTGIIKARFLGGTAVQSADIGTSGTHYLWLTAVSGNTSFNLMAGSTFTGSVDNVELYPVLTAVPAAPTIGTATPGDADASVTFTAPTPNGGPPVTGYRVTSSPGALTADGASSPITVTGLTNGVEYTFTVAATNSVGYGASSTASNAVTPTAANLISNGTFADATGWTLGSGMAVSGGTLNFSGSSNVTAGYNLVVPAGTYYCTFDILNYAAGTGGNVAVRLQCSALHTGTNSPITENGAKNSTITTLTASTQFQFRVTLRNSNPLSMSIDNVVLVEL